MLEFGKKVKIDLKTTKHLKSLNDLFDKEMVFEDENQNKNMVSFEIPPFLISLGNGFFLVDISGYLKKKTKNQKVGKNKKL